MGEYRKQLTEMAATLGRSQQKHLTVIIVSVNTVT